MYVHTQTIAGGSEKEFKGLQADYESDLTGVELALYQAYMYGAVKVPVTEDPRISLRPLFQSKMSDGLIKFAQANGIAPKVIHRGTKTQWRIHGHRQYTER